MVTIACAACGKSFTPKRSTAKYCSSRCRVRASRAGTAAKLAAVPAPSPEQLARVSSVEDATRRALEAVGREGTVQGVVALSLARRLDAPSLDTGSSIAAVVREHRAAMTAALEGTSTVETPLQRMRRERELGNLARG